MWRLRRGMSQAVLAGLVGVTQGYVSQVENALAVIDKRSTLAAFAAALQVSVAELCEAEVAHAGPRARAEAAVPQLRVVLTEISLGERYLSQRGAEQVRDAVVRLRMLRDRSDYATILPELPQLARDASAMGGVELAAVGYLCASALRELRHGDLAWTAASICATAAGSVEDPTWMAVSASARLHAMPTESGRALTFAERALAEAEPFTSAEGVRRVYGMLHLQAALAATVAADTAGARTHMAEAVRLATELGEPQRAPALTPHMHFGPTNVALWRISAALEAGDPVTAAAMSENTAPQRLESPTRTTMFWIDRARALAGLRRDEQAVTALLQAEATAPQLFRLRREAQDAVATLVGRARRHHMSTPLGRLARTFTT